MSDRLEEMREFAGRNVSATNWRMADVLWLCTEIDRLRAERDAAKAALQRHECVTCLRCDQIEDALRERADTAMKLFNDNETALVVAEARAARYRSALGDARAALREWGAYAGDYHREKWGFDDDIAAIDAVLAEPAPALPAAPAVPEMWE